jgi:hypothetical protein
MTHGGWQGTWTESELYVEAVVADDRQVSAMGMFRQLKGLLLL